MKSIKPILASGRYLWSLGNSLHLTITIVMVLVCDLTIGYFLLLGHSPVFEPMNQVGLWAWIQTYALNDLKHTAWFLLLLLFLSIFALNTLICTVTRLFELYQQRQQPSRRFKLKLAAHIMHIGIVIILVGYLLSYTLSEVYPSRTLIPDRLTRIHNSPLQLELKGMQLDYYSGTRLSSFQGRVIEPKIIITAGNRDTGEQKTGTLGFNRPLSFQGYTVFLQRFHPTQRKGMNGARYVVVDIRRDPGVKLYFIGIIIFLGGLLYYALPKRKRELLKNE